MEAILERKRDSITILVLIIGLISFIVVVGNSSSESDTVLVNKDSGKEVVMVTPAPKREFGLTVPLSSSVSKKEESIKNDTEAVELKNSKGTYNMVQAKEVENAFTPQDMEEKGDNVPLRGNTRPISSFKMEKGTIRSLRKGDTFALPEIDGIAPEVEVKKFSVNMKSKTVTVQVASVNGDKYDALLTESVNGKSFITVETASGIYEMNIADGEGYVYSSADIKNSIIDYSKTDEFVHPDAVGNAAHSDAHDHS